MLSSSFRSGHHFDRIWKNRSFQTWWRNSRKSIFVHIATCPYFYNSEVVGLEYGSGMASVCRQTVLPRSVLNLHNVVKTREVSLKDPRIVRWRRMVMAWSQELLCWRDQQQFRSNKVQRAWPNRKTYPSLIEEKPLFLNTYISRKEQKSWS
jgi:hypothetical protein